jgi:hypothetical protein
VYEHFGTTVRWFSAGGVPFRSARALGQPFAIRRGSDCGGSPALVELGVGYDDSYFGFCQAVAEAGAACTCYGVDTFEDAAVYETASRHNDRFYRSFSHLLRIGFGEVLDQFSNESIGLLSINAFRTYGDARRGFDTWLAKVRPGGVILLHGIAVRSGDHGVWRYYALCTERIELEYAER